MRGRAGLVLGVAFILALLLYERAEGAISQLLFESDSDIKDWRRRHHWSVSCREWKLFGKWVVWRTRPELPQ